MTRYVIVGAGAVGAGIGGPLHQAGVPVVLVARGPHLAAIRADGLRLRTPEEDVRLPIPVVGGPDEIELQPDDVLVLATKTQHAAEALASWADAPVAGGGTAGERLPILIALNGVVGEDLALRYFARVYGVCVWMWSAHLEPGEVIVEGSPLAGVFHVSRVPAKMTDSQDRQLLTTVARNWSAARLKTIVPDDVMPWKYRKLITNVVNALQALLGNPPEMEPLARAAIAEGHAVLDGAGIRTVSAAEETADRAGYEVHPVPGLPKFIGGSTWQSLARATGNVETDYLNGEIVRIARLHGREAPINATLARLVREAAAQRIAPGSLTVNALAQLLGLPEPATGP